MRGKKLKRFREIAEMPHVLEYTSISSLPVNWQEVFGNDQPITLELACGKGEYTVNLARRFPQRNFIGIDIKGNRMWVGAKMAQDEHLTNVRFLRIPIDHIQRYFPANAVSEIWIIYPDPFLRESKEKKRLTHSNFLQLYRQFIQPNTLLHLKTDDPTLYHFTLETLQKNKASIHQSYDDAYAFVSQDDPIRIQTYYESLDIAQSKKVFYIRFSL